MEGDLQTVIQTLQIRYLKCHEGNGGDEVCHSIATV